MAYKEALEEAIRCLKKYADDDEIAGLNGSGCYINPQYEIELMIDRIEVVINE